MPTFRSLGICFCYAAVTDYPLNGVAGTWCDNQIKRHPIFLAWQAGPFARPGSEDNFNSCISVTRKMTWCCRSQSYSKTNGYYGQGLMEFDTELFVITYGCFRGNHCLHLLGRRVSWRRQKRTKRQQPSTKLHTVIPEKK